MTNAELSKKLSDWYRAHAYFSAAQNAQEIVYTHPSPATLLMNLLRFGNNPAQFI